MATNNGRNNQVEVLSPQQAGSTVGRLQTKLDNIQLNNKFLGFIYALQKKYSQDQAGNLGALITYYGFLSLFPLLVALLSIAELSILRSAHLKQVITKAMLNYFPLIGHQLQSHVHAQQKASIALIVSVLITIYGARGVASALQQAMNSIWLVPKGKRASGLKQILRSFGIIAATGVGFLATGFLSTYGMLSAGNLLLRILSFIFSFLIIFGLVLSVFILSLSSGKVSYRDRIKGSLIAAIGLEIIQALGGFLITHELKHFSSLYGSFAIVFVILFWIYLQVRILLYATELDSIIFFKLWPRSMTGFRITLADRQALTLYAKQENFLSRPKEKISVKFKKKTS